MKRLFTAERKPAPKTEKWKSAESTRADFEEQLRQMYWCERTLAESLPTLSKLATSYELTTAILAHLAVTENQIIRLIHVFDAIGERATGHRCEDREKIMALHENVELIDSGYFRDSAIITFAQQLMQHEVSTYGKLHAMAVKLGEDLAAEFLALAIKEEQNAFSRLNEIRLSSIYFDAAS
ncbi:ferritin-like domain-containing protein [Flavobacterium sp.]|uniref:YciE/YciF ferroxidase family protein n=1 Tax=Flavobacterium sp. TaxID=239 RepID=UPI0039E496F5